MFEIQKRHAPMFNLSIIKQLSEAIGKIIGLDRLNLDENGIEILPLSQTARINEINKFIVISKKNLEEVREIISQCPFDVSPLLDLKIDLDDNTKLIIWKMGEEPNLDKMESYFAIKPALKMEVGLNRFEDVGDTQGCSIGIVKMRKKNTIQYSNHFKEELDNMLKDEDFLNNEIFRIPIVRDKLTIDRFQNLFNSKISTDCDGESSAVTIEHNTDYNRMFFAELSKRPDLISNVLSSINRVRQNASNMKVLSIGSRTEAELFSLVNAGFTMENIECVDLFSYTPHIKIGDIHNLQYPDQTFDISFCGWVLEFCSNLPKAISELKRVTKKDGYIAIAGMHHPISTDLNKYNQRKHHEDRVWYCSVDNIKKYFRLQDSDFVFKSDIEEGDLDKRGEVVTIFKNTDVMEPT